MPEGTRPISRSRAGDLSRGAQCNVKMLGSLFRKLRISSQPWRNIKPSMTLLSTGPQHMRMSCARI